MLPIMGVGGRYGPKPANIRPPSPQAFEIIREYMSYLLIMPIIGEHNFSFCGTMKLGDKGVVGQRAVPVSATLFGETTMTKRKLAALVSAPVPAQAIVASPAIASNDEQFILNLLAMSKKDREAELLKLTMGEVTIIGARAGGLAMSCYAVLAMKMTQKHGEGWQDRKYGGRVLTDLEKEESKALKADLDAIKGTLEANNYSNISQAIRYIKDHAAGKIGKKREANANKAKPIVEHLHDILPPLYRRLNKSEGVREVDHDFFIAVGAWLSNEANGYNLRELLADKNSK